MEHALRSEPEFAFLQTCRPERLKRASTPHRLIDWDSGDLEKCQKHGVSIVTLEKAFQNNPAVMPDRTARIEERFNLVSIEEHDRGIFVVFTIRMRGDLRLIRPISARCRRRRERQAYAKRS